MTTATPPVFTSYTATEQPASFGTFILQAGYRKYLYIGLAAMVGQLIIFKLLYPFADYFSGSYSFIENAITHDGFNRWPVGYSWFLYAFHQVTHSDTAVVVFQYFLLELAIMLFFFTVLYWYPLSPLATGILFVALLFNPLSLYVSNYISSDALFSTLSILWLTLSLWMLHRPRVWQIWPHALLLILAFTIRYQAMYYPLVTGVVFLLSKHRKNVKIAGLVVPLIPILIFIQYTRDEAFRLTGVHQFSVQSDWHWANNALYMYPHITVDSTRVPYEVLPFHRMTQLYFDTIPNAWRDFTPLMGGIYFSHPYGPLKQYLSRYKEKNPDAPDIEGWGQVAPTFGTYGKHLIKSHPAAYARYYILPNTLNYFRPPLEKLVTYNLGTDEVFPIAAAWFDYPSTRIRVASQNLSGITLLFVPMFFLLLNVIFVAGFVWFVLKGYHKQSPELWRALILMAILWLLTAGFHILAAPVALRYLLFPFVVFAGFVAVMADRWFREEEQQSSTVHGPQSTV
jgi:hypothetical protein